MTEKTPEHRRVAATPRDARGEAERKAALAKAETPAPYVLDSDRRGIEAAVAKSGDLGRPANPKIAGRVKNVPEKE